MGNGRTSRLSDVADGVIRPLSQAELKAAVALLKDLTKQEPALAEHLSTEGPLRNFVLAAFTLSPYLRDVANLKPSLLLDAVSQPLEPQILDAIDEARHAWVPETSGATPGEAEVMARLRRAKRKVAFLTALADLARVFTARDTTAWLTSVPMPRLQPRSTICCLPAMTAASSP